MMRNPLLENPFFLIIFILAPFQILFCIFQEYLSSDNIHSDRSNPLRGKARKAREVRRTFRVRRNAEDCSATQHMNGFQRSDVSPVVGLRDRIHQTVTFIRIARGFDVLIKARLPTPIYLTVFLAWDPFAGAPAGTRP